MIIVSLERIIVSLSCVRAWDWGLPCWVKLGVRSIEESGQKDVTRLRTYSGLLFAGCMTEVSFAIILGFSLD